MFVIVRGGGGVLNLWMSCVALSIGTWVHYYTIIMGTFQLVMMV